MTSRCSRTAEDRFRSSQVPWEDYPSWKEDILDWEHSVKLPDKVKGSRLVLAQNDVIKAIMRRAGPDNVRSAEGFNLIMKVMDSNFTQPEKDIGWYSLRNGTA